MSADVVCFQKRLRAGIVIFGAITRPVLEEIVVRLDIRGKVYNFTSGKLFDGIKGNLISVMVDAFKVTGETHSADILTAFGLICGGHFIFREDRRIRALRDARAAVNAGIGIYINPRPFVQRKAGDHALNRANLDATSIADAQAGNNMGHIVSPYLE